MAEFKESEHPRDKDGKFTDKGNGQGWTKEKRYRLLRAVKNFGKVRERLSENLDKPLTQITDNAVNGVKEHQIDGYTPEQCKVIAEQHKELLRYARDNNENKEVAFIFNGELGEKEIIKGSDVKITFSPNSMRKGDKMIIMHNHPRNSSFSLDDLEQMFALPSIKTMTIVKNNGTVEVLTKTSNIDNKMAYAIRKRYADKFENKEISAEKASIQILKKLERLGYVKWIKEYTV